MDLDWLTASLLGYVMFPLEHGRESLYKYWKMDHESWNAWGNHEIPDETCFQTRIKPSSLLDYCSVCRIIHWCLLELILVPSEWCYCSGNYIGLHRITYYDVVAEFKLTSLCMSQDRSVRWLAVSLIAEVRFPAGTHFFLFVSVLRPNLGILPLPSTGYRTGVKAAGAALTSCADFCIY
jgi:hypothetical protein